MITVRAKWKEHRRKPEMMIINSFSGRGMIQTRKGTIKFTISNREKEYEEPQDT